MKPKGSIFSKFLNSCNSRHFGFVAGLLLLLTFPCRVDAAFINFQYEVGYLYHLNMNLSSRAGFSTDGSPTSFATVDLVANLDVSLSPAANYTLDKVQYSVVAKTPPSVGIWAQDSSSTLGLNAELGTSFLEYAFVSEAGDAGNRSLQNSIHGIRNSETYFHTALVGATAIQAWDFYFDDPTPVQLDYHFYGFVGTTWGADAFGTADGTIRVSRTRLSGIPFTENVAEISLTEADLMPAPVPEPSTLLLLGSGLAGLGFVRRKFKVRS